MLILRRITSEGNEVNTCLGESYNYVNGSVNVEEFKRVSDHYYKDIEPSVEVFAFIVYNDGSRVEPLYKKSWYYIMASNGQTFDNLTFK